MGFINLLKNGYRGKLGETVGQKWKNQLTVRTYQSTNNSKSEAQLDQRAHYKALIQEASKFWPSSYNLIVPKKKSMSKYNYFVSIYEKVMGIIKAGQRSIAIDLYREKNIFQPDMGQKDGYFWLYVFLPEGKPPAIQKNLPYSVIFGLDQNLEPKSLPENFISGEVYPKRIKDGALLINVPRGYFVKTNLRVTDIVIPFLSIGKRTNSGIKWSEIAVIGGGLTMADADLEDL